MCVCVCVCVCVYVLFGPVKPELGVIPSGQENHSGAEHLNFPGRELNVIDFTEQYFFKEKNYVIFFFVFLVHTRNEKQDGNKFIILK